MRDRSFRIRTLCLAAVLTAGVVCAGEPAQAPPPAAEPAAGAAPAQAPRIKFDSEQIDLGDVVHGQDAVATFTYRNTGTAPLHILTAKPG